MINKIRDEYHKLRNKILKNNFWAKLFDNFIFSLTGEGGASGINLITLLIMTASLGTYNYGLFVLAQSYMSVIDALINFQSWQGVIKFGCEAIEEKDEDKLRAVIKGGFIIDSVSAIIGCIIGIIISPIVLKFFNWDSKILILMIMFSVSIMFHISGTPTAVLRLFQKFKIIAIHSIATAIVRLIVLGMYTVLFEVNVYIFTLLYVSIDIIRYIVLVFIAMIEINKSIGIKKIIHVSLKKLNRNYYSYTIWTNLSATFDMPVKYFDVFFLSMISIEIVAVYKVFKQVLQVFGLLITPISQALMPQLGELIAKDERARAYSVVLKIRNTILKVLIPIASIGLLIAPLMFKVFFEPIYYENYHLFIILVILNIATLSYIAIHSCFLVMGFAKENTIITIVGNLCYIAIAYLLVNFIGLYGIIIATAIQFIIDVSLKSKKIISHIGPKYIVRK